MKSKIYFYIPLTFILTLTLLDFANCDVDAKHEIGVKFGEKIKTAGLEFFQVDIKYMKQLCEKLLKEAEPTAEERVKIQKNIDYLEKLTKEIDQMTVPELITAIKEITIEMFLKYTDFNTQATKAYEADATFVKETISDFEKKWKKAAQDFAMAVYNNWTEIYKTISKEELEKHQEYEDINNLMQDVEREKGKGPAFLNVIKNFIKFFEYKEWYFVLEINEPKSNDTE